MSEESIDEATKEKQNYSLDNALSVLEELEKEAKMFSEEKMNLLDIEEKLILRINKEIENKRQMREQLKMEVEDLRKKCEGLTNFLNSHIKELGGGVWEWAWEASQTTIGYTVLFWRRGLQVQ